MKAADLRGKSADELTTQLGDLQKEAFNLIWTDERVRPPSS